MHKNIIKSRLTDGSFLFSIAVFLIVAIPLYSSPYYVSKSGADSNSGTERMPFLTVQKALDALKAGDACFIKEGEYNEALVLKVSGTESSRITIQNYNNDIVTINSGDLKSLRTGSRHDHYTIEGLRFIAEYKEYEKDFDFSIDLEDTTWDGPDKKEGGNNGFIIRNCYVEGALHIYGHNNIIEKCELNGKDRWKNGIWCSFMASYDNIFRNNKVNGYIIRGIWSMESVENILVENNTVFHVADIGIDLDGAGKPVKNCKVIGNNISDIYAEGSGVELENAFNSRVEKNIIHDVAGEGVELSNYGPEPSSEEHKNDKAEYRDLDTNSIIKNNIIYNCGKGGIVGYSSPGASLINNIIYGTKALKGYFAGITLTSTGKEKSFYCANWKIKDNIIIENNPHALWISKAIDTPLKGLEMEHNLYYHSSNKKTHYEYYGRKGKNDIDKEFDLEEFKKQGGLEKNSTFSDPQLLDEKKLDFKFSPASPVFSMGLNFERGFGK